VVSRNPILIAEDNEDDAELVRLAIGKAGIPNPVHIVRNGAEVLLYLKAEHLTRTGLYFRFHGCF